MVYAPSRTEHACGGYPPGLRQWLESCLAHRLARAKAKLGEGLCDTPVTEMETESVTRCWDKSGAMPSDCPESWQGRRREERRRGEWRREETEIFPIYSIYLYILSYTFIYLYIFSNIPKYFYIPSYTPIYFKISNIWKIRINIRPKNGHNSSPRACPRVRI